MIKTRNKRTTEFVILGVTLKDSQRGLFYALVKARLMTTACHRDYGLLLRKETILPAARKSYSEILRRFLGVLSFLCKKGAKKMG